jgi:hypothetical protein
MGGPPPPPSGAGRVRIKGRHQSVARFFLISVAYTLPWILLCANLGPLSRQYGPQVLLQLNVAFYVPSIPVLLLAARLEALLDRSFGAAASLAARLLAGLAGCAAVSAGLPFLRPGLTALLLATAALGALSAVAFSASYQLVSWFRAADTIALGIGCVGSGPLALAIQLFVARVAAGSSKRQWLLLFELGAAGVVAGGVAAASLLRQYYGVLSGRVRYDEATGRTYRVASAGGGGAGTDQGTFQAWPGGLVVASASASAAGVSVSGGTFAAEALRRQRRRVARRRARLLARREGGADLEAPLTGRLVGPGGGGDDSSSEDDGGGGESGGGSDDGDNDDDDRHLEYDDEDFAGLEWAVERIFEPCMIIALADPFQGGGGPMAAAAAGVLGGDDDGDDGDVGPAATLGAPATITTAAPSTAALSASEAPTAPPSPMPRRARHVAIANPRFGAQLAAGSALRRAASAESDLSYGSWRPLHQAPGMPPSSSQQQQQQQQQQQPQLQGPASSSPSPGGSPRAVVAAAAAASPARPATTMAAAAATTLGAATVLASARRARHWTDAGGGGGSGREDGGGVCGGSSGDDLLLQAPGGALVPAASAALGGGGRRGGDALAAALEAEAEKLGGGHDPSGDRVLVVRQQQQHRELEAAAAVPPAAASAAARRRHHRPSPPQPPPPPPRATTAEALRDAWPAVLAALLKSTALNTAFPFFTYIPSSGPLGPSLPQAMFYGRIFADIAGRFLPRFLPPTARQPPAPALLAAAFAVALGAAGFVWYVAAAPLSVVRDWLSVGSVSALWLLGGWLNTTVNVCAPAMVRAPRLAPKASSIMALSFQFAHLFGLALAFVLIEILYGEGAG